MFISSALVERLKKSYNSAVANKQEQFVFDGKTFLTSHAKYFIEYAETLLKR
jgi:hypothetical protein